MRASSNGHVDVACFLVDQGADVNATGMFGWTSLILASNDGHVDKATTPNLFADSGAIEPLFAKSEDAP